MEILRLKHDSVIHEENLVLCIGFFDGLHRAHRRLVGEAVAIAARKGLPAAMMTFSTHVLSFLKNEQFRYLTPLEEKIAYAESMGFAYFYVLDVDWSLVGQDPDLFILRFLSRVDTVVVGFDFSFGCRGLGTPELLKSQPGFATVVLPEMREGDLKIGSTGIRNSLKTGDLATANRLLGSPYSVSGRVVSGKGRGRILGFPTLNLDYGGYFLPKAGVYATRVKIGEVWYPAMTNVGDNPTFQEQTVTLETHAFGYSGVAYEQTVTLEFLAFIRDEIRFDSPEMLIRQMETDRRTVLDGFEKGWKP